MSQLTSAVFVLLSALDPHKNARHASSWQSPRLTTLSEGPTSSHSSLKTSAGRPSSPGDLSAGISFTTSFSSSAPGTSSRRWLSASDTFRSTSKTTPQSSRVFQRWAILICACRSKWCLTTTPGALTSTLPVPLGNF
ncbi:hypothetical protein R1flu_011257, partial [Riccia fluitans]